ncbi:hypothetical protein CJD36_001140 [Flavipsychrobacter stenotrophus]|uniref:Uncharacterized protein n=1 Tax=Flavipsychrobacter stenotrophus TaxID=2077091 RepID=A0A2S7T0P1_9BACT|nr:hypothetical protein [Flavipsychrobacter stenotrophus]PQJ12385.1 hypothetical protein CJD36_001140 [Flavipsychrobacter stenotrophus]
MKIYFLLLAVFFSAEMSAQMHITEQNSWPVVLDNTTPVNTLIKRFEGDWKWVQTNKFYWIGYTDLMYSIAAKRNVAIKPLLNFINTTKNRHAKWGAICTIHLIGINSEIAGRETEEFTNLSARNALLSLLSDTSLQAGIIELLIRDPRYSDIPIVMNVMRNSKGDTWALNNYLTIFPIDLPVGQEIPKEFDQSVKIQNPDKGAYEDVANHLPLILNAISNSHSDTFFVDQTLLCKNLWGNRAHSLVDFKNVEDSTINGLHEPSAYVKIRDFLYDLTGVDYCEIGNKLQYYVDGNKVFICTQETAKKRLLSWWTHLLPQQRKLYSRNLRVADDPSAQKVGYLQPPTTN